MARRKAKGDGGGGGAFSSITGTPTEVAYFDALGNGTSNPAFWVDESKGFDLFVYDNLPPTIEYSTVSFSGSGINDLTYTETYTGTENVNYTILVDSSSDDISISNSLGFSVNLIAPFTDYDTGNGILISMPSTGYTNGDQWNFNISYSPNEVGSVTTKTLKLISTGGSGAIDISSPVSANYGLVLPPAQGASGETLINDGAGVLSWGSPTFTGTANRFVLFDVAGNGTTDELAQRDATTKETSLFTEFGEYTGGFFTGEPSFRPGIGMYGLRAFRSDDTSSGLVALFSADSTGSDVPDGVSEFKSFENQFGSFTQLTGGGGYGIEFDSGVTDNQFKESVNETLRSSIYVNTDYSSNSVFQQSPDEATIAWANGPLSNPAQERIVIQSSYTADNAGSVSQQMDGYADIVKSAVGQSISTPAFTGTGLDDIIVTGTYTSSGDTVFTVTVIATDALRLNFNGGMDTDGQFAPGTIVTGSDSGATGEVAVATTTFVFLINTTGTFNTNDILTGDDGNISTVLTSVSGVAQDVVQAVTVNQFGTQSRFMGISMGSNIANDGISLAWGSETGHDIGDEWEFTVSRLYAERTIVPAKTFTVPVGTYVDIFEVALPAGTMASGFFEWTVNATDGTDFQTRTSRRAWSAVNAGGTITANIGAADTGASVSSGTLVSGFNYNTGTDIVTFNIDATSSLTTTSMEALVNITNNSKQNITVLY